MALSTFKNRRKRAFTLVEMLLVIAVIGILTALVVAAISNAAQDTRVVIGRQQNVVLQEALNSWVTSASSGTANLSSARSAYSAQTTSKAKLIMLKDYLDPITYDHMILYTVDEGKIQTEALTKAGLYLQFSAWSGTSYPKVEMIQP